MSFGKFFWVKISVVLFKICWKLCEILQKKPLKAHVIDVYVNHMVSNWRYPITKSSNRIPVVRHPHSNRAPITWQIGAKRTNHDQEFCYRYDYNYNRSHRQNPCPFPTPSLQWVHGLCQYKIFSPQSIFDSDQLRLQNFAWIQWAIFVAGAQGVLSLCFIGWRHASINHCFDEVW